VLNLTINDFEFIKPITRGGFARVYLAKKKKTGDMYAIKVMSKAEMIKKVRVPRLLVAADWIALTLLSLSSLPSMFASFIESSRSRETGTIHPLLYPQSLPCKALLFLSHAQEPLSGTNASLPSTPRLNADV
jgi:serine/threonine protein kinase